MASANGTDVAQYLRYKENKAYLKALAEDLGVPENELVFSEGAGRLSKTWGHLEVGIDLAKWVSIPFRIWANRVLRDVIIHGGHIRDDATFEQLQALQEQIEDLQEQNRLLAANRELTALVRDFMDCCIHYAHHKALRSAEWQPAFVKWVKHKYGKDFYFQLSPTAVEVTAEMDRLLKLRPEPKNKRIHIDVDNRYGDLENAALLPKNHWMLRSDLPVLAGYSKDVGE
jgi:hypothetical protein